MALCPHCRHAVPDPPVGLCPNCGGDLQAAGLPPEGAASGAGGPGSAGPPPPLPGRVPEPARTAWDQRSRIGFFNALVETTKQVLTAPGAFFRAMPVSGGIGSPLLYAVVMGWIGLVAASFYQAIFYSVVGSHWAAYGRERPEIAALLGFVQGWAGFVAQVVFGWIFVAITVFVVAGILHLMLLLLGGARRDFEATFRAVAFSQATGVLLLVPFCGQMVSGLWTLVLYVIGLAGAHQIGHGKAAAAVLLPLLLCCCCAALLGFLFAGTLAGLVGHLP